MFSSRKMAALLVTALATGCQSAPTGLAVEAETSRSIVAAESATDKYGIGWIKTDDGSAVIRVDTFIDAPIDVVWSLVRDPNGYASFNKALTAQIERLEVGAPIKLYIRLLGDALPPTESDETVEIFDEQLYVASWGRDFGNGQMTHRPQLLEVEGSGTHYYTALQLPPALAWIVMPLLGTNTKAAFERFACGLREAALRKAAQQ